MCMVITLTILFFWSHFVQRFRSCSMVRVGLHCMCLDFWLNIKCKETGWFKKMNMPFYFRFSAFTASLFWHTHQAEWHPTHQLSAHVKFTQCADRQKNSRRLLCVCAFASACMCPHACVSPRECVCGWLSVCTTCQCVWEDVYCSFQNVKDGCDGCENTTHRVGERESIVETIRRYEFSEGVKHAPESVNFFFCLRSRLFLKKVL